MKPVAGSGFPLGLVPDAVVETIELSSIHDRTPREIKRTIRLLGGMSALKKLGLWSQIYSEPVPGFSWSVGWRDRIKANSLLASIANYSRPLLGAEKVPVWLTGEGQSGILLLSEAQKKELETALTSLLGTADRYHSRGSTGRGGQRLLSFWAPQSDLELLAVCSGTPPPKRLGFYHPETGAGIKAAIERVVPNAIDLGPVQRFSDAEKLAWRQVAFTTLSRAEIPSASDLVRGMEVDRDALLSDQHRVGVAEWLPKRTRPRGLRARLAEPMRLNPQWVRRGETERLEAQKLSLTQQRDQYLVLLLRLLDHPSPAVYPFMLSLLEQIKPHKYDKEFLQRMRGSWSFSMRMIDLDHRERTGKHCRRLIVRYRNSVLSVFQAWLTEANLWCEV